MKKFFSTFLLLLLISFSSRAQIHIPADLYVSGGLNVGYTFGAGFTFGYEINTGLHTFQNSLEPVRTGITFGRYWVSVRYRNTHYVHRIKFLAIMAESNYYDLKCGLGQARNKWGSGGNNRCRVHGIYYDMSFTSPDPNMPWIGIKRFNYPAEAWAWFWRPYNTLYAKYKLDFYGTSGIKPEMKLN